MPKKIRADVAVVGGGLAGLVAALWLEREGYEVAVLEARDRVGGRLSTVHQDRYWIDEGGQWLGEGQNRIYGLAFELGLELFPTHTNGDTIAVIDGTRYRFRGEMPRLDPLVLADFAQGFWRFERVVRGVSTEAPWRHPRAARLDAETIRSWAQRAFLTAKARKLFELFISAVFAADPEEISLLFAAFYVKGGGSFRNMIATQNGAQQDRVVGGTQQIVEKLASNLQGPLLLGCPVSEITQDNQKVEVRGAKTTLSCARAVVAIPPSLAARIAFEPALPGDKQNLLERMPPGSVIKFHAVYEEPFWRSEGLSGEAGSTDLPISFTFDNSPPEANCGVLVGFAEGRNAQALRKMEESERRRIVLDSFREYFGHPALEPAQYFEKDWSKEPWTRGCYAAHMPPWALWRYGEALRAPVGRVHFAGTETARIWPGYMEGAIESGERVAYEVHRQLARARKGKSDV